ncbi:MAG TPA: hypothetical protein VFP72_03035 [Kineosporiaceae bacterium]|nr:hypothetical protein [Kineosporiaceae bacterium]
MNTREHGRRRAGTVMAGLVAASLAGSVAVAALAHATSTPDESDAARTGQGQGQRQESFDDGQAANPDGGLTDDGGMVGGAVGGVPNGAPNGSVNGGTGSSGISGAVQPPAPGGPVHANTQGS